MTDLRTMLAAQAERFGDRAALCNGPVGTTTSYSFTEVWTYAQRIARHLIDLGIAPGDRIAILSESRAEWGLAFFGAFHAGAVVVPMDTKMSPGELQRIVQDSEPRALFASPDLMPVAQQLRSENDRLQHVFLLDSERGGAVPALLELDGQGDLSDRVRSDDDLALIFYTSGTMGSSKGVMISVANLNFQLNKLGAIEAIGHTDRFISILPLSHVLELSGGLLYLYSTGATIIYARTIYPQELLKLMRERKATAMVSVPLFFQVLKTKIENEIRGKGRAAQLYFQSAQRLAESISSRRLRRIIFFPIIAKFGGHLRIAISGGAPLDPQVDRFFNLLGIQLLQGYGMTETSPVIAVNIPSAQRSGSVGRPLDGVEVKILRDGDSDEGEILARGPLVMKGYYKRDDVTKEVIDDDGWLHTGDRGRLDSDGYLYVTGRVRSLIVLGNGLKVQPEEVEEVLGRGTTVQEICVCAREHKPGRGQRSSEICAVVTPHEALWKWSDYDPQRLRLVVETEIEELSRTLAQHKRPKRVIIHDGELPKTTTRKVKRLLVQKWLEEDPTALEDDADVRKAVSEEEAKAVLEEARKQAEAAT